MPWKKQLKSLYSALEPSKKKEPPSRAKVEAYLHDVVAPALEEVRSEIESHGRTTTLDVENGEVLLAVQREGEEEFCYAVKARTYRKPTFAFPELPGDKEHNAYYRAEVYIDDDAQGYGIFGYPRERVIRNFLDEYEKTVRWRAPARKR